MAPEMQRYLHPRYWAVALLSLASFTFLSVLGFTSGASGDPSGLIFGITMLAFGLVGALVIAKAPGNRIGWVFAAIGIVGPFNSFQQLAYPLLESGANPDLVAMGQIAANTAWSVFFLSLLVLVPLWYPTGKAINRYVAAAGPLSIVGLAMVAVSELGAATVSILVDSDLPDDLGWIEIANPLPHLPEIISSTLFQVGGLMTILAIPVAVTSMIIRRVRSKGIERLQMRWLLFFEGLFVAAVLVITPVEGQIDNLGTVGQAAITLTLAAIALAIPVSVGIAITKHRLYDIDVVISKTVTYGALALCITGIYAAVVVGIGSFLGSSDESDLVLSIAAVAIVAVAFEPLRNRVQRWANRLVFGDRASPYEVLSSATTRLATTDSSEDALAQVTQLVVDGTGAAEAVLWLNVGGAFRPSASAPEVAASELGVVPVRTDEEPSFPGQASTLVRHGGEILGAVTITKPAGTPVTDIDEKMLADIGSGTGLLLRNLGLNAELARQADQLRESRRRLVAAHDAERHRLERDLHDGAQQQVVAIKVKLGIARTLAEREEIPQVEALVSSLADATQDAVDAMRSVAHGIYPPLLESEGLVVALTAASRTTSIPIDIEIDVFGRYERPIEESMYFCILETLTHAIDGGATHVRVDLTESPEVVGFSIRHDGTITALLAVDDRAEALGGWVSITSSRGEGRVRVELPLTRAAAVTS